MLESELVVNNEYDLVCVGGGIMSATLALITKLLDPSLKVIILEKLDDVAQESSSAWNNAGTGHSALCELNYTPEDKNGEIKIEKAIDICRQFEISKQFWSYLVNYGYIDDPSKFILPIPHHSWVEGEKGADYLEKRYKAMKEHFMFDSIEFTRDIEVMRKWFPLIAEDRMPDEVMGASRIERGTEMNFGSLTKELYSILEKRFDTQVWCNMEVLDVDPDNKEDWSVIIENTKNHQRLYFDAKHVFIGAGGGSLLLLQKAEIEQRYDYGGFPVSGQWLVCKNQHIIDQHFGKVYSSAGLGDPPMSVPHLDTRFIDGKRELLFGPFAGFSPKFLKGGSNMDLMKSIKTGNIKAMMGVFWHNLPLTEYLIKQVSMSFGDRMNALRRFVKNAKDEDWEILVAGQRVQVIKKDEHGDGVLEFGTEVISGNEGKVTCLLGASPGASTSVNIMLRVLEKAFPEMVEKPEVIAKLKEMIPFWKTEVDQELFAEQLAKSAETLKLG